MRLHSVSWSISISFDLSNVPRKIGPLPLEHSTGVFTACYQFSHPVKREVMNFERYIALDDHFDRTDFEVEKPSGKWVFWGKFFYIHLHERTFVKSPLPLGFSTC